jgi:hypothetical protein
MVGLHIASKVRDIPRIGIDEETLNFFGLIKEPPLTLSYSPRLKERGFLSNYNDVIDSDFLEHSRVEIDGVLAAVGSQRLWEYIMHKLTTLFPKRDYRRVIFKPVSSSPGAIGDIEDYIEYVKYKATHTKWEEIEKSLSDIEGMIDIIAKRKEIEDELQDLVTNHETMKAVVSKFEELKAELQVDSDKDFVKYRKDRIIEGQQEAAKAKEAAAAAKESIDLDDDNNDSDLDLDDDLKTGEEDDNEDSDEEESR